jgi:hypothetical protein
MAICHPDNAIWPDPSVLPTEPGDDATAEEIADYELAEQRVEIALGLAWTTLQTLTAYQIAICPITVRPCGSRCSEGSYFIAPVDGPAGAPFWPYLINGQMVNILCGCRDDPCSCSRVRDIALPGPVGEVVEVSIDGSPLPAASYRIDNGNRLVRQDGEGWPFCQDFNRPAGDEGTFTVTYYHGSTSDILVRYAAGLLADEYLKGMQGGDCRLPAGTVQAIRQGVTFEIEKDMFDRGLTGIAEVDAVTARYNPYRQKLPPQVFSLDQARARETTWGA